MRGGEREEDWDEKLGEGGRLAEGWGVGGGGGAAVEPAGLNSTAEPLTLTIHQ